MRFQIDVMGRVANTDLSVERPMIPIVEAVINSIQATPEHKVPDVSIEVTRAPGLHESLPGRVTAIEITDKGVGFDEENYRSFYTFDTRHKAAKGGKGMGRVTWLKVFKSVSIESSFLEDGVLKSRAFSFDGSNELGGDDTIESSEIEPITRLRMSDPDEKYATSFPGSAEGFAEGLLEEMVAYFLVNAPPNICVTDNGNTINVGTILNNAKDVVQSTCEIQSHIFIVRGIKLRSNRRSHRLTFLAHGRRVTSIPLSSLLVDASGSLRDAEGAYEFVATISSEYFDTYVTSTRQRFDFPSQLHGPGLDQIRDGAKATIEELISGEIARVRKEKKQRVMDLLSKEGPQYKSFVAESDVLDEIGPEWKPEQIMDHIRQRHASRARTVRDEIRTWLEKQPPEVGVEAYEAEMQKLAESISDVGRVELADYVMHRKAVIDLLRRSLELNPKGKQQREDAVHTLLAPMKKDSEQMSQVALNVWVVDDRLAFSRYLCSDLELSKTPVSTNSKLRPDILVLSDIEAPTDVVSIVEIKRPSRPDKDVLQQTFRIMDAIKNHTAKAANGKIISKPNQDTKFFVYILIDDLIQYENYFLQRAFVRTTTGWYWYNDAYRALFEVKDYDGLLQDADQRNRAFIDKLGL